MTKMKIVSTTIIVGSFLFFAFQNCSQPGTIALTAKLDNSSLTTVESKVIDVDLTKSKTPPLKLFLVVDNSNSMRLSQLNLKKSISAMFDKESQNISEFDTEIFMINTNQLPGLIDSTFLSSMLSPEQIAAQKSISDITGTYRTTSDVNGLIAGDSVGFLRTLVSQGGRSSYVFLPAPVAQFSENANGQLQAFKSIKFKKGDSIDKITQGISDRLDTLDPNKTQKSYGLFKSLDKESGMCAMARLLRNDEGLISQGDLASFILISDENESDPTGAECIESYNTDLLYNVTCNKNVAPVTTYTTTLSYNTASGTDQTKTTVVVRPQDKIDYKKKFTLSASAAAKNAVCSATYQPEFIANYQLGSPQFELSYFKTPTGPATAIDQPAKNAICEGQYQTSFGVTYTRTTPKFDVTYTEAVYIDTREGGTKYYKDPVAKTTATQTGLPPGTCNEAYLRTVLGSTASTTSLYANIQCVSRGVTTESNLNTTLSFAQFTTDNPKVSTACSAGVLANLVAGRPAGSAITSCVLSEKKVSISSLSSFNIKGSSTDCDAAVAAACSSSSIKNCDRTNYIAYVPEVTRPITYTRVAGKKTIAGAIPVNCATEAYARTAIGDSTSTLDTIKCTALTNNYTNKTKVLTYAAFPSVNIASSNTCSNEIKTNLLTGQAVGADLGTCTLTLSSKAIPANLLGTFPAMGTAQDCAAQALAVCQANPTNYRNCAVTNHTAGVAAKTAGPIAAISDVALTCDSTCSLFPGLCDAGSTATVKAWATSKGMTCKVDTIETTTLTFNVIQNEQTLNMTYKSPLSCESTCALFPGACGGTNGAMTIKSYNKECRVSGTTIIPGASSAKIDLKTVEGNTVTCETTCANSKGACGTDVSAQTIESYISKLQVPGINCLSNVNTNTTPAGVVALVKKDLLEKDIATACTEADGVIDPTKIVANGKTVKSTDFVSGTNSTTPAMSLAAYIKKRFAELIGTERSTLSVFITTQGQQSAGVTSWGQEYENLASQVGGSINNIKDDSYAPALRNLSSVLRDQLQRSLTVAQVSSNVKITKVWRKSKSSTDWGEPLNVGQWSATGNTITFNSNLILQWDDEVRIEYQE